MLYDILFIDDDFGKQSDSTTWESNAQKLFLEYIRKNLRVTYTTGEVEDFKKFSSKDLSCIRYIFCDLHLIGISENDIDNISSKLVGIFKKLGKKIKSEKVRVFINSKFPEKWDKLKCSLKEGLKKHKYYEFEAIKKKNAIPPEVRNELVMQSLEIYLKSLIFNKAIEVEKIFDNRLNLSKKSKELITFESKFYVIQSQFNLGTINSQIQLLQQIRNKLAHTDNELTAIKDPELKKIFWEICLDKKNTDTKTEEDAIEFKKFEHLMEYIKSIDDLIEELRKVEPRNTNTQ